MKSMSWTAGRIMQRENTGSCAIHIPENWFAVLRKESCTFTTSRNVKKWQEFWSVRKKRMRRSAMKRSCQTGKKPKRRKRIRRTGKALLLTRMRAEMVPVQIPRILVPAAVEEAVPVRTRMKAAETEAVPAGMSQTEAEAVPAGMSQTEAAAAAGMSLTEAAAVPAGMKLTETEAVPTGMRQMEATAAAGMKLAETEAEPTGMRPMETEPGQVGMKAAEAEPAQIRMVPTEARAVGMELTEAEAMAMKQVEAMLLLLPMRLRNLMGSSVRWK